jgi:hypothetical protein
MHLDLEIGKVPPPAGNGFWGGVGLAVKCANILTESLFPRLGGAPVCPLLGRRARARLGANRFSAWVESSDRVARLSDSQSGRRGEVADKRPRRRSFMQRQETTGYGRNNHRLTTTPAKSGTA